MPASWFASWRCYIKVSKGCSRYIHINTHTQHDTHIWEIFIVLFLLSPFFWGRRQGRQPLIRPGAPWPCPCRRRFSPLRRREGPPPLPPTTACRQKPPRFTVFCARRIFLPFPDLVAQDGSTWANIGLKMGQDRPQDGPT